MDTTTIWAVIGGIAIVVLALGLTLTLDDDETELPNTTWEL